MYLNLFIDFGIGLIPVLGDFADAWFKCNTRNNILLERYLRDRGLKHPALPPPPNQPTVRQWPETGPSAPESHPQQPVTAESATPAIVHHPTLDRDGGKPDLPARNGMGTSGRERDLEAQMNNASANHYETEG
jgi:Domain of unknown function (DUF4112)